MLNCLPICVVLLKFCECCFDIMFSTPLSLLDRHVHVDYIMLSRFASSPIEESSVLTVYPNSYTVLLKIIFSVVLLRYYFLPQSEFSCYVICI